MKALTSFWLMTITASVLFFALAGGAMGTTLCKENQTPCSPFNHYPASTSFKMSLAPGTKLVREIPGAALECGSSTSAGEVKTTGGEASPVEIGLSSLSFSSCTCPPQVLKAGQLTVQSIEGTMNGTVRWAGFEITEHCSPRACTLAGEVSKGITLKGGAEATLRLENAAFTSKSGLCGANITGTYKLSAPAPLFVSGATSESFSGNGVLCRFEPAFCLPGTYGPFGVYGSGTSIKASLKSATTSMIEAGFANVKCEESSLAGEVLDPGSSTEPIVGSLTSLTFGKCNCQVEPQKLGSFSIDWTSGSNGSLVLTGFEIDVDCGGKECTFGSSSKEGMTLAGGNPAAIKVASAPLPKKAGIAECSSTSKWTAEYEVTAPKPLFIDEG